MKVSYRTFRAGLLLVLSILIGASLPSVSYAVDYQFYALNDINYYDPSFTNTCGTSSDSSTVSDVASGDAAKNEASLMKYMVDKGLTVAAAAGVAGNTRAESGFIPNIIQGGKRADKNYTMKSGVGFGIAQWTSGGRQKGLAALARQQKKSITDLGVQLDFLWSELSTSYKTSTLNKIKNLKDPRQAAKIYMVHFEAPADQSSSAQNGRANLAQNSYNRFKGKLSDGNGVVETNDNSSTDTAAGCDSAADTTGGTGVANGFTFPLKTTQKVIKTGVQKSVWCFESQKNCHHDYNAADIFAPTGTPIIAAKPGRVVQKTTDACTNHTVGCNVTIMGDDKILYYYTHMNKHAIVNTGQHVQAGQQVGAVGTNQTAMGTPHHLHFDMLPGNKYKSRPPCSGAACRGYPLINVQPYLTKSFNALPKG